jgi:hypothetical protein
VRRKSGIHRNRQIVEPKFGFMVSRADVNVRRLSTFVRVKEGTIGTQRKMVGIASPSSMDCGIPKLGIDLSWVSGHREG